MFALLLSYTLLYPVFVAPDEAQHVDMVVAMRHDAFSWPDPATRALAKGVAGGSDPISSRGPRIMGPYLIEDAAPRDDRKSIAALGGNAPTATPPRYPNQLVQHPPLYYAASAAIIRSIPGSDGWSFDAYVWFLRFLNVCLITPLPLLAWATTRRLTGFDGPAARVAAVVPLAIPGLTRIGSAVNNDNLVTLMSTLTFFTLVPVALGDMNLRRAAKVGAVLGLALMSKIFAVAYIPVVGLAYLIGWRRHSTKFPVAPALTAGAFAFVFGGWWHLRSKVLFGTFVPNGFGQAALDKITARFNPPTVDAFGKWRRLFVPQMHNRFWSTLGQLEPPALSKTLTAWLTLGVLGAIVIALIKGVARRRPESSNTTRTHRRRDLVLLGVVPIVFATLIVVQGTYSEYKRSGYPGGMQGRYLYCTVVPLAAVVCASLFGRHRRWHQLVPLLAVAFVAFMQIQAVRLVVRTVWSPPLPGSAFTRLRHQWGALSSWSPLPSGMSMAIVALVVASGLWLTLSALLYARRLAPPAPEVVAVGAATP